MNSVVCCNASRFDVGCSSQVRNTVDLKLSHRQDSGSLQLGKRLSTTLALFETHARHSVKDPRP